MTLPPYAALLGVSLELVDDVPVVLMPFGQHVVGRPGYLQGGAISGLLEVAAIAALRHALTAEGARIKPINATVDFLRGGRDHDTRAMGTITRLGSRVASVEAVAWQEDRARPIAGARMNYLIERRGG